MDNIPSLILEWKINFYILSLILILELILPARKLSFEQNAKRILLGTIYLILTISFIYPATTFVNISITKLLDTSQLSSLKILFDIRTRYTVFSYVCSIAIYWVYWDFFQYWIHRLLHSKAFYKLHEHHHNVELDAFASFRHAPVELIFIYLTISLPSTIFFAVLAPTVSTQFQFYIISFLILIQHSNIRFGWPINIFFITPQMHRIHHSTQKEHWNHNFSQYFTLWDFIFGTLYIPKKNEYPITGPLTTFANLFSNYTGIKTITDIT